MYRLMTLLGLCLATWLAPLSNTFAAESVPPAESGPWDGFNLGSRQGDRWQVLFSPFTYHYTYSEEHKQVLMVGAERERADGTLTGMTVFTNSFGQPSTYIFPWGHTYRDILGYPGVFAKWTAGLLYGYKSPYDHKVPLNHKGYSPGFIPAVGWESAAGYQLQVNFLGNAGLMLQASWQLPR